MKKPILLFLFVLIFSGGSRASHLMGGEITWQCQSNGQYVFTMILYRDCAGIPIPTGSQSIDVFGLPGLTNISLPYWSTLDITYCQPQYNCNNAPPGATEQGIYTSNPITLNGVPPLNGWTFVWHSCCRNGALTNLNPNGFSLRATMYPFNGQNTNPCFDSSPQFAEKPKSVLCSTQPYVFNHGALDRDMDSLYYEWGQPLEEPTYAPPSLWNPGINPAYSLFNSPYSATKPLPFNPPNIGASIDPSTGEINFTSFITGNFVSNVKVTSYKCGVKVSEIFREIQFVILNCDSNNNPDIMPPFQDSLGFNTLWADTVMAGDPVSFNLSSSDFDLDSLGMPQEVTLSAYGLQFGANFNDTATGCLIPPCAVINLPMPTTSPIGASVIFNWQTTVAHLGMFYPCAYIPNTYYFNFKATDSHCPAPAVNYKTVAITVLPVYPKPGVQNNNNILTCLAGGFNYQWYRNRFEINGATGQSYTPVQTGFFQVRITDSIGSGNFSDAIMVSTLNAISEANYQPSAIITYPNPAKDEVHITMDGSMEAAVRVEFIDLAGRIVYSTFLNNDKGNRDGVVSVKTLTLDTGVYVLKITGSHTRYRGKLAVIR